MSNRPGFSCKTTMDQVFTGSESIDDQVGFYRQKTQPGVEDINARAGQLPAAPDDRFSNVIGTLDNAAK